MGPASPQSLVVQTLMPGAHVVRHGGTTLALGFPEEIVKTWMRANVQPTAWLIPDVRTAHGVIQWALEFPLYHALFFRQTFARGEKIPVIVREDAWPDVVEYLRLTLLGLTREEMRACGVDPVTTEMLARESDHLALKRPDGTIARIEDFLAPIFFDARNRASLGGLEIEALGPNHYAFSTEQAREELHLEIPAPQLPPYALPASPQMGPQPFELVMLGASNGFDPANPCSNMAVQCDGRFLLVDSGPYIRSTLRHAGISPGMLDGLVITHAHEDHAAGLSALLGMGLTLFISRENAEIMRRKLAILNHRAAQPGTLLDDAFKLVIIETTRAFEFRGMSLRFHHTFHSIPCTGVEIEAHDRKLLIVGDSDARAHIESAFAKGAISNERHAQLMKLYAWAGDLIVADAGEGAIHGAPIDFAGSATPVVHVHTGKPTEGYTLSRQGCRYTLAGNVPEALSA